MGNAYVETEFDTDMDDCYPRARKLGRVQGESAVKINLTERGNLYDYINRERVIAQRARNSLPHGEPQCEGNAFPTDAVSSTDRSPF